MHPIVPTRDDLRQWACQAASAEMLPRLVRRLLLETVPLLSDVHMPAGRGIWTGGFDGRVRAGAGHAFCPQGESVWELSVSTDPSKRDRDLAKRTREAAAEGGVDPTRTAYVAVTLREVKDAASWGARQTAASPWRSVRELDLDDIATWLEQAPATAAWLASETGAPAYGYRGIEEFLSTWESAEGQRLPRELLLLGDDREAAAEAVREWAAAAADRPLHVQSSSPSEARAFVAAALAADDVDGEAWLARTIVAVTEDAYLWATKGKAAPARLIVPAFDTFASSMLPGQGMGIRVVVPTASGADSAHARSQTIALTAPPMEALANFLVERCAIADGRALAMGSGGDITSLRRLLGHPLPSAWQDDPPHELISLLLVGAWIPTHGPDRAFIAALGSDSNRLEDLSQSLSSSAASPVLLQPERFGLSTWTWRAPDEAWQLLSPHVSSRRIAEFLRNAADLFDASAAQSAEAPGGPARPSGRLREGVLRTVNRLAHGLGGRAYEGAVAALVRRALPHPYAAWEAASGDLSLLAEADPETFLDCLDASLQDEGAGAAQLLALERNGGSAHAHLLWALERIGWSERLFPRVTAALARLAEADTRVAADAPGTRLANRPLGSLARMVDLEIPDTNAAFESREAALRTLIHRHPETGFSLALGQLPRVLAQYVPRNQFGTINPALRPEVAEALVPSNVAIVAARLTVGAAGTDAARWTRIIAHARALEGAAEELVLDALEQVVPVLDDASGAVWRELRGWLSWDSRRADRRCSKRRARWSAAYEQLKPVDWFGAHAWLFAPAVTLPDAAGDWHADQRTVDARRRAALEEMWARGDRWDLVGRIGEANNSLEIARCFAALDAVPSLDERLLAASPAPPLRPLAPVYAAARSEREPAGWLEEVLRRWSEAGLDDLAAAALHRLPATLARWTQVDGLPEGVQRAYWRDLWHFGVAPTEDASGGIERLLAHDNVRTALTLAAHTGKAIAPELVIRVLTAVQTDIDALLRLEGKTMLSHYVDILLGVLGDAALPDEGVAAHLELGFLPLLDPLHHPHRFLSRFIERDPGGFVDLLEWGYRKDDAIAEEQPGEEVESRQRAAATVFASWRGFPGDAASGGEKEKRLEEWARRVFALAKERQRSTAARIEVASVLARAGVAATDKRWPCAAARVLLEEDKSGQLGRLIRVAKYNLRGVTSRALGEGGRQERQLVAEYESAADGMASAWPETARMLRDLANTFAREADDWDASSALDARVLGEPKARALSARDLGFALYLGLRPHRRAQAAEQAGRALELSDAEANEALARLLARGILHARTGRANVPLLIDALRAHALSERPADAGGSSPTPAASVRGLRTGWVSSLPLLDDAGPLRVWPFAAGTEEGVPIEPACPGIPSLARADAELHEAFALFDLVRLGRARERRAAIAALRLLLEAIDVRRSAA